jgi:hypothetical protein
MSIDGGAASLIDSSSGQSFVVPMEAPGGILPAPGDMWKCVRDERGWHFDSCLRLREPIVERTFREVLKSLSERGLITHSFVDGDGEAPHLAYIGEVRLFAFTPPAEWVPCAPDDTLVLDRVMYRELAAVVDPGTSSTFTIPSVTVTSTPSGAVKPYICAR